MDERPHIGRRVLVQLLVAAEDEDSNIDRAEHRELVRLLEQAALALQEGPMGGESPVSIFCVPVRPVQRWE